MNAAQVLPINSPDVRWLVLKEQQKLDYLRAVRRNTEYTSSAKNVYAVIFDLAWKTKGRRVKLLHEQIASEAGMPLSTTRDALKELREGGDLGVKRYAYIIEWILAPTDAEKDRKNPNRSAISAPERECQKTATESAEKVAVSRPHINLKERARSSSSNSHTNPLKNEKVSEVTTIPADDFKPSASPPEYPLPQPTEKPSQDGVNAIRGPVAISRTQREQFADWFKIRFKTEAPERELDWIERTLSSHGLNWAGFRPYARERCGGKSTNPIGLIKSKAKEFAAERGIVRYATGAPLASQPDDWHKLCNTCQSKAGLLFNGKPCPDCQLGRDLARVSKLG